MWRIIYCAAAVELMLAAGKREVEDNLFCCSCKLPEGGAEIMRIYCAAAADFLKDGGRRGGNLVITRGTMHIFKLLAYAPLTALSRA